MPLLSTAANLADLALRQVNRLVTPECRQIAYVKTRQFAAARPLLFVSPNCLHPQVRLKDPD